MAIYAEDQNPGELESPAKASFIITGHASNEVGTIIPRGVYIGGNGDLVVRLVGDTSDRTFLGLTAGTILPVRPTHVRATSTATGLLGLY